MAVQHHHNWLLMTYNADDGELLLAGENTATGLRPTPRLFTADSGVCCRFLDAAFNTITLQSLEV